MTVGDIKRTSLIEEKEVELMLENIDRNIKVINDRRDTGSRPQSFLVDCADKKENAGIGVVGFD